MTELTSVGEAETGHSRAVGIARGAGVIAGITMLARILGLIRTLAFSQTVGATCLGSAYFTASQVPDLVAELVLGGALGSAMVPVLGTTVETAANTGRPPSSGSVNCGAVARLRSSKLASCCPAEYNTSTHTFLIHR